MDRVKTRTMAKVNILPHRLMRKDITQSFILTVLLSLSGSDGRDGKDSASTTEELELELEALDITDEPLELEGADEAENEELAKKLLDEQGKHEPPSEIHLCTNMMLRR